MKNRQENMSNKVMNNNVNNFSKDIELVKELYPHLSRENAQEVAKYIYSIEKNSIQENVKLEQLLKTSDEKLLSSQTIVKADRTPNVSNKKHLQISR